MVLEAEALNGWVEPSVGVLDVLAPGADPVTAFKCKDRLRYGLKNHH